MSLSPLALPSARFIYLKLGDTLHAPQWTGMQAPCSRTFSRLCTRFSEGPRADGGDKAPMKVYFSELWRMG